MAVLTLRFSSTPSLPFSDFRPAYAIVGPLCSGGNDPGTLARPNCSPTRRGCCPAASIARCEPSKAWAARRSSSSAVRGSHIEDVDGNTYVDYVMSWGPLIHGHAPKGLRKALAAAAVHGTSFGAPTELETQLAARVVKLVPSMERIRFVSSGTEAAMSALRVARAAAGCDLIIKFEGCYHGHADAFLVQAGSGAMTLGVPTSPGVSSGAARDTLLARYNDLASVEALFAANRKQIAAVFVEPIAGNMGVVLPKPGFLEGLRAAVRSRARPARLRRSDLRISCGARWRAAAVRHPSRSDVPGQDHRRRPPGRSVWRPRRRHGARRSCGPGLSGGNTVGESSGHDRRLVVAPATVAEDLPPHGCLDEEACGRLCRCGS